MRGSQVICHVLFWQILRKVHDLHRAGSGTDLKSILMLLCIHFWISILSLISNTIQPTLSIINPD
jgi:hypothetical protein